MAKCWEDLPEECWEAILDRLKSDQDDLESLSLVCKRFLSLSNGFLSILNISDRMVLLHPVGESYPLSRRFQFIRRIHLDGFHGDLDRILQAISRSDLRLEALDLSNQERLPVSGIKDLGSRMNATMKTLICANIHSLEDHDLIAIGDSLPDLEALDLSYPDINKDKAFVTDSGILALSLKLRRLKSINLAGNIFISDNSLIALSSNCPLLSEISAKGCSFFTSNGINFVLRHSSNLCSLSVDGTLPSFSSPNILESFCSGARSLRRLELYQVHVSDDLLFVIGETQLPLQKLVLSFCPGFTFTGISGLLRLCRSLHHFDLEGMDFLTDEEMAILSEHFQCLISIGLSSCTHLKNSTFFNLANNCPSLEEIRMETSSLGKEHSDSVVNVDKNCRIHSLRLGCNEYLSDGTLERIGNVCPKLRLLDVSHCRGITEVGISVIGKRCTEIRELRVGGCVKVQSLGSGSEFSKLEVLIAFSTGFGDEGLGMIGRGCPRLRVLNLNGCLSLTDKGLQELMKGDTKGLRKLDINYCCNVKGDFLARMVFSSPSLKTIVAPASLIPTTKQRDLFLRHGCLVTDNGRNFHGEPQKTTFW